MANVTIDFTEYQKLLGKEPVTQSTAKITLSLAEYEKILSESQMTPEEKKKKRAEGCARYNIATIFDELGLYGRSEIDNGSYYGED
jgi:hypothetical protein